jgi:hypothetical protein
MNKYLLGVIIIIVLYVVYSFFFKDHTSANLVGMHNAKQQLRIEGSTIPGNASSIDFTFSIWVYVNDWNYQYGEKKHILVRGNKALTGERSPVMYFDPNTNDVNITVNCYPKTGSKSSPGTLSHCKISNVPIQKWTHILFTTNNKTLDTYLDGKLVRTCVLSGVPKMDKKAPLFLTPGKEGAKGFSGYTSKLRYYSRTLNPREVYDVYKEGYSDNPLGNLLGKYKMKVAFLKGSEEMSSFQI